MPYSDFTSLHKLEKCFNLQTKRHTLFTKPITPLLPSEHLRFDLEDARKIPLLSEKAKSEILITPILREIRRHHAEEITFLSGVTLDVMPEKNLTGICDFIISKTADAVELKAPIGCIVEAKNRTLEEGLGQCAAEMLAARYFNQQNEEVIEIIFGCVTNGYDWLFLQLREQTILVDEERYFLYNTAELLGVWRNMVKSTPHID